MRERFWLEVQELLALARALRDGTQRPRARDGAASAQHAPRGSASAAPALPARAAPPAPQTLPHWLANLSPRRAASLISLVLHLSALVGFYAVSGPPPPPAAGSRLTPSDVTLVSASSLSSEPAARAIAERGTPRRPRVLSPARPQRSTRPARRQRRLPPVLPAPSAIATAPASAPQPSPEPEPQPQAAADSAAPDTPAQPEGGATAAGEAEAALAAVGAAAPAAPGAGGLVFVGDPQPIFQPDPDYPKLARVKGRQGVVEVIFTIDKEGATRDARVSRASPAGTFERAALEAIAQWRYSPPRINGVSVERPDVVVVIEFRIGRGRAPIARLTQGARVPAESEEALAEPGEPDDGGGEPAEPTSDEPRSSEPAP